MKAVKIKNLPNKFIIIEELTELVKADEYNNGNWPLTDQNNLPTEDFYVLVKEKEIIPAYIKIMNETAMVLWVHKDYRRKGYGQFLVKSLNIKYVIAHEPSLNFWQSLGFKTISKYGEIKMKLW